MQIGIIGSGNVGKTLARGFVANGHTVTLGTRNPDNAELRDWAAAQHVALSTLADAARVNEVIVLATPWANGATENAVRLAAPEHFAGKVVVDTVNPLVFENGQLQLALDGKTSGSEMVQSWLPKARVVKAFNTIGAEIMIHPQRSEGTPDLFVAGNDADAKKIVGDLAREFGWNVIDAGDLTRARLLEAFALLWIDYARVHRSRVHAFKLLKQ
jgi:hypothetical protein